MVCLVQGPEPPADAIEGKGLLPSEVHPVVVPDGWSTDQAPRGELPGQSRIGIQRDAFGDRMTVHRVRITRANEDHPIAADGGR
jgi:hypothetical protein